jgi:hypothetical protein
MPKRTKNNRKIHKIEKFTKIYKKISKKGFFYGVFTYMVITPNTQNKASYTSKRSTIQCSN